MRLTHSAVPQPVDNGVCLWPRRIVRPMSPIRILLMEDTRVHARIVERFLAGEYEMEVVESAEDALTRLEQSAFDLLIVDWVPPGADGLRFIRALRQSSRLSQLPVIMQTAKDRPEHVRRAVDAGASDDVVKPLDCASLRAKIRSVV